MTTIAPAGHKPSRAGTWLTLAVLCLLALFYVFPFVLQVLSSFKTDTDATNNPMGLPQTWTTAAYQRLFQNSDFPRWFANSVLVTVVVTAGRVFFNSLAGYALARLRFPGRKLVFITLIAVMSVPGVVLPMATPALVTITILSFQGSWNEYSHFIIASSDPNLMTLTKGVGTLASGGLGGKANQYPLKLAAAAIMTIPVALLFFVFQKRIMNTSAGAVKE